MTLISISNSRSTRNNVIKFPWPKANFPEFLKILNFRDFFQNSLTFPRPWISLTFLWPVATLLNGEIKIESFLKYYKLPYLLNYKPGHLFCWTAPLTRRLYETGVYSRPACIVLIISQVTEYQRNLNTGMAYCTDGLSITLEFHFAFTHLRLLKVNQ